MAKTEDDNMQHHQEPETKKPKWTTPTASSGSGVPTIPCFSLSHKDGDADDKIYQHIATAFEKFQVVHLPNYFGDAQCTTKQEASLSWKDIGDIYHKLQGKDKDSWCIENNQSHIANVANHSEENKSKTNGSPESLSSNDFLQSKQLPDMAAYCSFLVQHDTDALKDLLQRVPLESFSLPPSSSLSQSTTELASWDHEPCVWIFFGRNTQQGCALQGRPEHTDSISHDGTWHYQLSGIKHWRIRPSPKLLEYWNTKLSPEENQLWSSGCSAENNQDDEKEEKEKEDTEPTICLEVDCCEGDVLIVNTRLWKHQTIIPTQPDPSVSYARDFWTGRRGNTRGKEGEQSETKTPNSTGGTNDDNDNDVQQGSTTMTNLDGLYANNDIDSGTIIFREDDMPDCELHRSNTNPNCEVVTLEDGTMAVVSSRSIAAGEFFCVPESDSEGDDDEEEIEMQSGSEVDDDESDADEL